ncbi:MAG: cytochrome c oxidase accessory protein CcoG [Magnetospirillum sp.]|nr:cytochrome c oxidase accessory protein CcoG [Magnetospirillum sp.]
MAIVTPPSPAPAEEFYADTKKIQPRNVRGIFRQLKWWAMAATLAWWHLAPFMRWDRGPGAPDQAILLDMEGRRIYFFFLEIWPQEIYYLTGLLLFAAITLFFVSALAGRVWCGFFCWQTVYTDLFVAVERWVIGDRNVRIAFEKKPFARKFAKKALIHAAWLAISAACGIGFTLYFGDAFDMLREIFTLEGSAGTYGAIAVVGGGCYLLAGFAREQVCIYMCPYSRFQAAMFDEHSLLVSYEPWRGEPRGRAFKNQNFEGRGHCVDCRMCVQSCPTGIDIREGSQLACIGCALCVDACNAIMDKFGLPRGLISYDSITNQDARGKGEPSKIRVVRPRTILYAILLAVIAATIVVGLALRSTVEVNVLHERTPLFVQLSDGSIRNGYTYKILNMVREDRVFRLETVGVDNATIDVIGGDEGVARTEFAVPGDQVGTFRIFVSAPDAASAGTKMPVTFVLTEQGGRNTTLRNTSVFAGPEK